MKISGQTAIVTGSGSGLGAETARQLAAVGAKLVLLDWNIEGAEQVARETNGLAIQCDVSSEENVEQVLKPILEKSPIRICVNCAGIAVGQPIVKKDGSAMPLNDFNRVVQINLIGTFNVMRIVAAAMSQLEPLADNERGVIINTASVAAFEGQIGQTAYSASKAGIVGLTLPAARELARYGIRVVAIAPGLFETPLFQDLPENVRENLAASVPFPKRLGKSSEFAHLVQHIVENPMLNGSVIRLDGALRMAPK